MARRAHKEKSAFKIDAEHPKKGSTLGGAKRCSAPSEMQKKKKWDTAKKRLKRLSWEKSESQRAVGRHRGEKVRGVGCGTPVGE